MVRRVFFSFHFDGDAWRTNQVRNAGVVTRHPPVSHTRWEQIRRTGARAIRAWIDPRIEWASCTIVLIGEQTAERPWVRYEIAKSWEENKALLGIRIHRLLDSDGRPSGKGPDPFSQVFPPDFLQGHSLQGVVPVYDPPGSNSRAVYAHITANMVGWVEQALLLRDFRIRESGDG
ncbi:MAG: TIR domain-containing protein [Acidobacteriota bacterium]|nr:TIR domain-containing protein [Acidobacteriota bacterium]